MCAWTSRRFALVMVGALCALWGCGQTTDPEEVEVIVTPTSIEHLSIGPMEIETLVNVEDPATIADVLALLSEEEWSTLERGEIVHVEHRRVATAIARTVGLDTSDPAVTEGGVLLAAIPLTWGQLKCCYKDPECCPKKKKKEQ